MLRRLLTEPLVHFLLLGAGLFLVYGLVADEPPGDEIVVTQAEIRRLENDWQARWRRPPTDAELTALIDDYLREELLYREALALGLDQGDEVIRRRLAQKLVFIETNPGEFETATEEQLQSYYATNRERYKEPARVSFEQRLFHEEQPRETALARAKAALAALRAGGSPAEFGDPSPLQDRLRLVSQAELALLLGEAAARQIFALPPGDWQGPVESSYGQHLLRITERRAARQPPMAEIRERIRQDWLQAQQREAEAALVARLKSRYRIRIEPPAPATDAR